MKSHPNVAKPETENCPKCGSDSIKKDGVRVKASGIRYQTFKCNDCGGYFHDGKNLDKPQSKL